MTRDVLVAQIVESERRVTYVKRILAMPLRETALDPASGSYDPLKAAVLYQRAGNYDEACWQVLLSVHFGKSRKRGWDLAGYFYGRMGQGGLWDWATVSQDVSAVRDWLSKNRDGIREMGASFGNHRKYESLDGRSNVGTGELVETYVDWVDGSHADKFESLVASDATPSERYAAIYRSLASVRRLGRTGRFDYVTMLGKQELVSVAADSAHLVGASGPKAGARLLFDGDSTAASGSRELERRLAGLAEVLDVSFDVLEDALCNWQKSPNSFVGFRG
jgi:hypothetical protein